MKSKDSSLHQLDISLWVLRLNHLSKLISIFAQHSVSTTQFVDLSNVWLWRDIASISHQKPDQNKWMRCKGLKFPFTWAKNNRPVLWMSQQLNTPAWTWLDNFTNFQTVHQVDHILLHDFYSHQHHTRTIEWCSSETSTFFWIASFRQCLYLVDGHRPNNSLWQRIWMRNNGYELEGLNKKMCPWMKERRARENGWTACSSDEASHTEKVFSQWFSWAFIIYIQSWILCSLELWQS